MSPQLFLIKFTHSLVVIYMLVCLYIIWQYGINGLYERWLGLALGSILLEAAVYILWGFRCPLTDWAIALGDDTGADFIGELLLLGNVNFVSSFATFFASGMMLVFWRYFHENAVRLPTKKSVTE